ncbi:type III polyketide synthase [uncultured Imperialibacter sp.]|uniref:type III polyketide synthase n=1 Tax=uncultured Imperialibacter sp. TaxID=1672639 RepID=UPI0030DDAD50|tara:strand:- start:6301 stop:7425 length:1125 start_codon:yes stop_codon:yes gene_type:complete
MESNILGIGTATPAHRFCQSEILGFMIKAHGLTGKDATRLEALYRASGIRYRHSVLDDYGAAVDDFTFYPKNERLEPFPTISPRMERYRQEALPLCLEAVSNLEKAIGLKANWQEEITHLVTVSCTGMYAPGLDLELLKQLGLTGDVQRTAINFMGCYAAFNAMKVADNICRSHNGAQVLVVCVELCTLHFQNQPTEDNLLANALFADGAAAMLISGKKKNGVNLTLANFHCDVDTTGENDMAWQIGDFGFEMKLSSYVPDIIKGGISKLTQKLLQQHGGSEATVDYFAIHPGGKRILEAIEEAVGIKKEQNWAAYETLREFGNMSSPTVLFVLKRIMESLSEKDDGKKVLSFAFGPGLTLESMLLEINVEGHA